MFIRGLLSCVQQCTDRVHSSSDCKHEPIQQCFRAFEILFKLVIQSRRLYARAILENQEDDDFRQYVQALFATFNKVASLNSDVLVSTQVIKTSKFVTISNQFHNTRSLLQVVLLRNIYTVVEQLSEILSQAESAKLLASLIDSLPKEPHPLIATARMQLVLTTVHGPLFTESSAARAILLATICRQLRLHLAQPLVMSLCTETLGHMMNFYRKMSMMDDTTVDNIWYRDVETVTLATLGVLIQAVHLAQKTDSNVVNSILNT
jgi:dedicator of cytokinesis protein 3